VTAERDPMLRVEWTDSVTGRKGYVVVDRLVNSIAGGGTRVRAGLTAGEIERLAKTMTYKCGAMNLAAGGAKGGIDCDPHDPGMRDMLVRFVSAMRPLLDSYWATAEDMGISQEELDSVFSEVGLGMSVNAALKATGDPATATDRVRKGLAVKVGGIGLADVIGGYGVAEAAVAAASHLGLALDESSAVIQGFGSMGGATGRYLQEHGVRVVGVVDVNGAIVNPDGLDVETLLASRNEHAEVDRGALRPTDRELPREEWLSIPAEIIVPAAVPDVLTAENADLVGARLVVEAANIPTTAEAQQRLHERGVVVVPDFVANSGANSWWWWTMGGDIGADPEQAFKRVGEAMRDTVTRMLDYAGEHGVLPRAAAAHIAEENLDRLAGAAGGGAA
jgi:glutamate dehydrogenase (NAD(P)+)